MCEGATVALLTLHPSSLGSKPPLSPPSTDTRTMRRSLRLWCSKLDLDGNPSRYFPRFRPRRLVMPVDPSDLHSDKRQPNPLFMKVKAQKRQRRRAEMRGAVQLASVPKERSVGDVYRLLMDACETQNLFSDAALTPRTVRDLESLLQAYKAANAALRRSGQASAAPLDGGAASAGESTTEQGSPRNDNAPQHSSPLYSRAFQASPPPVAASSFASATAADTLSIREVDQMWSMLDHTPLNAPVHGALALRGDALVRSVLLELTYSAYPRLRSKHVQQLLHETTGFLPCGRIAMRIGLAEHCGVEGDIAMWRELNVLSERMRIARKEAAAHLQRVEKGIAAQRRWYWRAVLRSAAARLKLFPVHKEDLLPRMQWVRSFLFAFVAFVEMAETSGDAHARVRPLIYQLFASQLARHIRLRQIIEAAEAIVAATSEQDARVDAPAAAPSATSPLSPPLDDNEASVEALHRRVAEELARVKSRTVDEEEVLEGRAHPMNRRADRRREQFESSGGAHGTQMLHDEALERHAEDYGHLAPPLLLHALESTSPNAFKEAQLVLRYAPQVSEKLRRSPIDVDQVVRRVVDVQETNNYASLHNAQQYRQVEYTVCRLYAGRYCLGEGKGETLMSAMQDASMRMLLNYYLRFPLSAPSPLESPTRTEGSSDCSSHGNGRAAIATAHIPDGEDGNAGGVPAPRIRSPTTEEEVVL
ncbi:spliced leader RNA PSE-promoter transcription factor, putative [Leishmania donovani]|uniref:Spliced leader RNA PSE-promoter transcription factor, putative n=2 Tax=Leishmania donovani TaxID=5661 RepID=E9BI69_LEIDO|nr:spliced leader RNA PSE-promoter transcription factor, putative [Leishmania donovani]CBZ34945.1 spliced leader RNA PSE-promoter transcription factor, putative [Leishmania donovani]